MNRRKGFWIFGIGLVVIILILGIYIFLNYHFTINSNELNIILTFALAIFASVEAFSAIANYRIEKNRKQTLDLKNELEKLYGPVYSVLNNVDYTEETKGILFPNEKNMLDKKFSTYPHMISQELYDFWKKEILPLERKSGFRNTLELLKNSKLYQNGQSSNENGAYYLPKTFILKFIEEYERKVYEYRKLTYGEE